MKAILNVIALVCLACSPGPTTPASPATNAPPSTLQLFRVTAGEKTLVIQMAPDDRVLDSVGVAVGDFYASSEVVAIGGMVIALRDVVRKQADGHIEITLPTGAWLIDIATSGEVRINGERWGQVEGFDTTPQAWHRLEALFVALPIMPTPESPRGSARRTRRSVRDDGLYPQRRTASRILRNLGGERHQDQPSASSGESRDVIDGKGCQPRSQQGTIRR